MSKRVSEMTNKELMIVYEKGKAWLIKEEQGAEPDKNMGGGKYNPAAYFQGLTRIESIEEEINKRGLGYD